MKNNTLIISVTPLRLELRNHRLRVLRFESLWRIKIFVYDLLNQYMNNNYYYEISGCNTAVTYCIYLDIRVLTSADYFFRSE